MRKVISHLGLLFFCAVVVLPIPWMVRTRLVPEYLSYSTEILPDLTFENYIALFTTKHFGTNYLNSIIVAVGSMII
ncbi:hypothetical protein [Breoghania sp.]|uniref:hypothetical protein n=1 Tax=Breoghania sp. TaxID=2065378 RepID=UPI002625C4F9|nr:hypothetical protein [Breoghania sp.]MDJ0930730.1 hypothetical protein [Breoghania sp.]